MRNHKKDLDCDRYLLVGDIDDTPRSQRSFLSAYASDKIKPLNLGLRLNQKSKKKDDYSTLLDEAEDEELPDNVIENDAAVEAEGGSGQKGPSCQSASDSETIVRERLTPRTT